jgi:Flp pilus assembly protein TadD
MDVHRVLLAAQGYFELGMLEEAHGELDALPESVQTRPEFLECRMFLLMQQGHWEDALAISRRLCEMAPGENAGYLQGAYCLHEMGRTEEARELLLKAPDQIRREALYFYNLGCYQAVLGNLEHARDLLAQSFQMDESLKQTAHEDQDLNALRDWLKGAA